MPSFVFSANGAARNHAGSLLAPVGLYHRGVDGVRGLRTIELRMVLDVRELVFRRVLGSSGSLRVHPVDSLLKFKVLVVVVGLRTTSL